MRPGELDTFIEIVRPETVPNEFGEPVQTWILFLGCFAKRTSRPGKEFFHSGRTVSESRVYFTIRHFPGITSHMRVRQNANEYDIVDVRESDKRGDSILLECKEVS